MWIKHITWLILWNTLIYNIYIYRCFVQGYNVLKTLKPATGRPCVPAFLVSGTVRAFTCDCLHLRDNESSSSVCLRFREQCLRSMKMPVARVAHVLLLCSVVGYRRSEYTGIQVFRVDRKRSDCSKVPRNPQKSTCVCLHRLIAANYAGTQGRPVAGFTLLVLRHER